MDPNQTWHGPPSGPPVGYLKILFWVDPQGQGGYNFGKTQKCELSPYGPGRSGIFLRHLLQHLLRNFLSFLGRGDLDTFLNGPSGARPVNGLASQANGCEASRHQLVF